MPGGYDLKVRIGRDAIAHVKFEGAVTKEGIEKLIELLEVQSWLFPTAPTDSPGPAPAQQQPGA